MNRDFDELFLQKIHFSGNQDTHSFSFQINHQDAPVFLFTRYFFECQTVFSSPF